MERPWILHWYTTTAGLTVTAVTDPDGKPAPAGDTGLLHFWLQAG
ncbi:hypothetical protein QF037_001037 [Streptomyces canus]|nr:hypothetical protein [Streptomyces canus]